MCQKITQNLPKIGQKWPNVTKKAKKFPKSTQIWTKCDQIGTELTKWLQKWPKIGIWIIVKGYLSACKSSRLCLLITRLLMWSRISLKFNLSTDGGGEAKEIASVLLPLPWCCRKGFEFAIKRRSKGLDFGRDDGGCWGCCCVIASASHDEALVASYSRAKLVF